MERLEIGLYESYEVPSAIGIASKLKGKSGQRSGKRSKANEYTGPTSIVSGLLFSGVGYAVGATSYLIKDGANYIMSEIPKIPSYLSSGAGYSGMYDTGALFRESLVHASHAGGMCAALGFFGGALFMMKLKYSSLAVLKSISSVFMKEK